MEQIIPFLMHHWVLSLLFIALLAAIFAVEAQGQVRGISQLSAQEVIALINQKKALIVDVRSKDLFSKGHIVNAISIPLLDLKKEIPKPLEKQRTKPIVVVCDQVNQGIEGAVLLRKKEFPEVYGLRGGLRTWQDAGLPLVKDDRKKRSENV